MRYRTHQRGQRRPVGEPDVECVCARVCVGGVTSHPSRNFPHPSSSNNDSPPPTPITPVSWMLRTSPSSLTVPVSLCPLSWVLPGNPAPFPPPPPRNLSSLKGGPATCLKKPNSAELERKISPSNQGEIIRNVLSIRCPAKSPKSCHLILAPPAS